MYEQVDDADDRDRRQHGGDQHRRRDVPRPRPGHRLPRGPVRVGHGVGGRLAVVGGAEVRQMGVKSRPRLSQAFGSLLRKKSCSFSTHFKFPS